MVIYLFLLFLQIISTDQYEKKKKECINFLIKERKKIKEKEKLVQLQNLKEKSLKKSKTTLNENVLKFEEKEPEVKNDNQKVETQNDPAKTIVEKPKNTDDSEIESLKSQVDQLKQMLVVNKEKPSLPPIETKKKPETLKIIDKKAEIKLPEQKSEEFRLKEKEPQLKDSEDGKVIELKQEMISLKDDLKDLKVFIIYYLTYNNLFFNRNFSKQALRQNRTQLP